jgi:guanine deaminase
MDADVVVIDLASTPLLALRMEYVRDVDEALAVQMALGDDRAIRATWVAGRCVHDRDAPSAAGGA